MLIDPADDPRPSDAGQEAMRRGMGEAKAILAGYARLILLGAFLILLAAVYFAGLAEGEETHCRPPTVAARRT